MRITSVVKLQRQLSAGHFDALSPEARTAQLKEALAKHSKLEVLYFYMLAVCYVFIALELYRAISADRSLSSGVAAVSITTLALSSLLLTEQTARKKVLTIFKGRYAEGKASA